MTDHTDLRYTAQHEWLRIDGDEATIGITDHATEQLGELVFADLPETGAIVTAGSVAAEVESTKSVGEVYAPVDGEIVATNDELGSAPEIVNEDPYGRGWLFRLRVADAAVFESAGLLTLEQYRATIGA